MTSVDAATVFLVGYLEVLGPLDGTSRNAFAESANQVLDIKSV
jgi:hypothetical protein